MIEGARTVGYTGPRNRWALCLLVTGGLPLAFNGSLAVNGGNRVSMPV